VWVPTQYSSPSIKISFCYLPLYSLSLKASIFSLTYNTYITVSLVCFSVCGNQKVKQRLEGNMGVAFSPQPNMVLRLKGFIKEETHGMLMSNSMQKIILGTSKIIIIFSFFELLIYPFYVSCLNISSPLHAGMFQLIFQVIFKSKLEKRVSTCTRYLFF